MHVTWTTNNQWPKINPKKVSMALSPPLSHPNLSRHAHHRERHHLHHQGMVDDTHHSHAAAELSMAVLGVHGRLNQDERHGPEGQGPEYPIERSRSACLQQMSQILRGYEGRLQLPSAAHAAHTPAAAPAPAPAAAPAAATAVAAAAPTADAAAAGAPTASAAAASSDAVSPASRANLRATPAADAAILSETKQRGEFGRESHPATVSSSVSSIHAMPSNPDGSNGGGDGDVAATPGTGGSEEAYGKEQQQQQQLASSLEEQEEEKQKRRVMKEGREVEAPSWLPAGWRVVEKLRLSGKTAGTKDKYYHAPNGRVFRSRNEVINFLLTGKARKPATSEPVGATSGSIDAMSAPAASPAALVVQALPLPLPPSFGIPADALGASPPCTAAAATAAAAVAAAAATSAAQETSGPDETAAAAAADGLRSSPCPAASHASGGCLAPDSAPTTGPAPPPHLPSATNSESLLLPLHAATQPSSSFSSDSLSRQPVRHFHQKQQQQNHQQQYQQQQELQQQQQQQQQQPQRQGHGMHLFSHSLFTHPSSQKHLPHVGQQSSYTHSLRPLPFHSKPTASLSPQNSPSSPLFSIPSRSSLNPPQPFAAAPPPAAISPWLNTQAAQNHPFPPTPLPQGTQYQKLPRAFLPPHQHHHHHGHQVYYHHQQQPQTQQAQQQQQQGAAALFHPILQDLSSPSQNFSTQAPQLVPPSFLPQTIAAEFGTVVSHPGTGLSSSFFAHADQPPASGVPVASGPSANSAQPTPHLRPLQQQTCVAQTGQPASLGTMQKDKHHVKHGRTAFAASADAAAAAAAASRARAALSSIGELIGKGGGQQEAWGRVAGSEGQNPGRPGEPSGASGEFSGGACGGDGEGGGGSSIGLGSKQLRKRQRVDGCERRRGGRGDRGDDVEAAARVSGGGGAGAGGGAGEGGGMAVAEVVTLEDDERGCSKRVQSGGGGLGSRVWSREEECRGKVEGAEGEEGKEKVADGLRVYKDAPKTGHALFVTDVTSFVQQQQQQQQQQLQQQLQQPGTKEGILLSNDHKGEVEEEEKQAKACKNFPVPTASESSAARCQPVLARWNPKVVPSGSPFVPCKLSLPRKESTNCEIEDGIEGLQETKTAEGYMSRLDDGRRDVRGEQSVSQIGNGTEGGASLHNGEQEIPHQFVSHLDVGEENYGGKVSLVDGKMASGDGGPRVLRKIAKRKFDAWKGQEQELEGLVQLGMSLCKEALHSITDFV